MTRNLFYRDFSICKAVLLVGLMGAASLLGKVSEPAGYTELTPEPAVQRAVILPAAVLMILEECDKSDKTQDVAL